VETDPSKNGRFQQPLSVLVEQGTEHVDVELLDKDSPKVLAILQIDVVKQIVNPKEQVSQETFTMKTKAKGVVNPTVKLSIITDNDEENNLLAGLNMSEETDVVLRQTLQKYKSAGKLDDEEEAMEPMTELEMLAKGCQGPVETFGSWGTTSSNFITVFEHRKKYQLCVWASEAESQQPGAAPKTTIPLLKISSVQADPRRFDVFRIYYQDKSKSQQKIVFRRVDRSRDAWTELLQAMITQVREKRQEEKHQEERDKRSKEKEDEDVSFSTEHESSKPKKRFFG
jgi:hypothetical protein